MITEADIQLMKDCLGIASKCGASDCRLCLSESRESIVNTLDGEIDKVTSCNDRSLSIAIFADGKYGAFSTNRVEISYLEGFIGQAVEIVRMMATDEFRKLPDRNKVEQNAITGLEVGSFDEKAALMTPEERISAALALSVTGKLAESEDWKLISEEGEYSDSEGDSLTMDSQGAYCRHRDTSFDYGVEVTVEDKNGDKYSAYWWESSPFKDKLRASDCGTIAVNRAIANIGAEEIQGGKYNMVLESNCAAKMVSPILRALNAYSLQQNNSFLVDSLGRKIFPEGLNIFDHAHIKGECGSRLFDSEGVSTKEDFIIKDGVVQKYFINSYMAGKMGMEATIEEAIRAEVLPWPRKGLNQEDILKMCGTGILVTDFNGGNFNYATGDFSYGVEGFLFEKGVKVKPVSGMLVTGNFLKLWSNFIASGEDQRRCASKLIPTLAFSNVDFNG